MQAIKPYTQIYGDFDGQKILEKIEKVARTCYKSEDKIKEGSAAKMVAGLIKSNHEAMLEHVSLTIKFVVDRGVSHELVRHRICSFAQESQRYCNYGKDNEVTFIIPSYLTYKSEGWNTWKRAMLYAESTYLKMLELGYKPEEARAVLPNSTKTEVIMTANLRELRHFFKLRAEGTTGKPHPQMLEVTRPLLTELKTMIPVVFDDITYPGESVEEDDKEESTI